MVTIGLPRMHKEPGEHRVFLPTLTAFLERVGAREIVVEEGYGAEMGLDPDDYRRTTKRVRQGNLDECLSQDVIVVLRCPNESLLRRIRQGATLVSMLHYVTRPGRVALLRSQGIRGVSLDGVVDDHGRRLVEDLRAVAWNGVRAAFDVLSRRMPDFARPGRRPLRVLTLGPGAVGGQVVQAAARYGDPSLHARLAAEGVAGVEQTFLDWDVTRDAAGLAERLARTDLLVDATARPDPTRLIVRNEWIGAMPEHAVILDLAVDPYDFARDPPAVKGIEGVPEGNLDKYVFFPEDPIYGLMDARISTRNRRAALSCYSWPGVAPRENMEIYSKQIEPVLRVVVERGLDAIDVEHGTIFERAVARADLYRWRE